CTASSLRLQLAFATGEAGVIGHLVDARLRGAEAPAAVATLDLDHAGRLLLLATREREAIECGARESAQPLDDRVGPLVESIALGGRGHRSFEAQPRGDLAEARLVIPVAGGVYQFVNEDARDPAAVRLQRRAQEN